MTSPEVTKLEGSTREVGRKSATDLRGKSLIPAVLYGPNVDQNIHFAVKELDLERILSKATTKLQDLTVDGSTYRTLLKKVDFDPVTDRPIHVDFYALSEDHPVTLKIPIRLLGTPKGVLEGGGRLFQPMRIIRIKVAPSKIPAEFILDVSKLGVGQSLRISDLELDGITPLDSPERTILTIRPPKSEMGMRGGKGGPAAAAEVEEEVAETSEGADAGQAEAGAEE